MSNIIQELALKIERGDLPNTEVLVKQAIEEAIHPEIIMNDGLIKGMETLGERWKRDEVFVPEVLLGARALNAGLAILKPALEQSGVKPIGKAIIGTVKGDLHDIGKNLVKMMLVGSGFEVLDLGVDVPEEKFVEAVKEHEPDVLLLSALLTTTIEQQRVILSALDEAGVRDKVNVMVGGAPVTQNFADEIGADAYTVDAVTAAERAKEFVL